MNKLTPKNAKFLSHRKNTMYCVLEDHAGLWWFVDAVLDNGRMITLFEPDTLFPDYHYITSDVYPDCKVIFGPEDMPNLFERD